METIVYLYYYQSIDGPQIPGVYHGTVDELRRMYAGSLTPLTRIITVRTNEMRLALKRVLEAQLTATPKSETGLRHSLETAVLDLSKVIV